MTQVNDEAALDFFPYKTRPRSASLVLVFDARLASFIPSHFSSLPPFSMSTYLVTHGLHRLPEFGRICQVVVDEGLEGGREGGREGGIHQGV